MATHSLWESTGPGSRVYLIRLAIDDLTRPKGVVYLDIEKTEDANTSLLMIAETFRDALGWRKDEAENLATTPALELLEILKIFSTVAVKYRTAFKKIPVLIIDKLPNSVLAQFQDFAKNAADMGIAKPVFVSSEGRVPRSMRGTSILLAMLISQNGARGRESREFWR